LPYHISTSEVKPSGRLRCLTGRLTSARIMAPQALRDRLRGTPTVSRRRLKRYTQPPQAPIHSRRSPPLEALIHRLRRDDLTMQRLRRRGCRRVVLHRMAATHPVRLVGCHRTHHPEPGCGPAGSIRFPSQARTPSDSRPPLPAAPLPPPSPHRGRDALAVATARATWITVFRGQKHTPQPFQKSNTHGSCCHCVAATSCPRPSPPLTHTRSSPSSRPRSHSGRARSSASNGNKFYWQENGEAYKDLRCSQCFVTTCKPPQPRNSGLRWAESGCRCCVAEIARFRPKSVHHFTLLHKIAWRVLPRFKSFRLQKIGFREL
jgi:hypothetical protein